MFEERSKNMIRQLIRTLTESGAFTSKTDALKKMRNEDWLAERGYGHVAHILQSDLARDQCEDFFEALDAQSMRRLTSGIHEFRSKAFLSQKELFERLETHQAPGILFITCSDSRIVPNLITQTEPGDMFVIRNAGNIIPPNDGTGSGEAATIEFAIKTLSIKDIIVCGHSNCGAMKGILNPEILKDMPLVSDWLRHAEGTRKILADVYGHATPEERMEVAIQENVLVQLENLRTHPSVGQALEEGKVNLHGWVYQIHTGHVFSYYPKHGQFLPVGEHPELVPVDAKALKLI